MDLGKELKNYLKKKEKEIKKLINEIPEEFECLEDSENYNYYSGILDTLNEIKEIINK